MKSNELAAILSPFAALTNKNALSPVYKTLEVSPTTIRGCAPWGILEVDAKIGTKETFWVDAAHFVGILRTLASSANNEVIFTQGASLNWQCGSAQGKFGLLPKIDIPSHDWPAAPTKEERNIDGLFPEALQLGSLSASRDIGMSSVGTTGVALTWMPKDDDSGKGDIFVTSSDNVTMSVSSILLRGADHWPSNIVIGTEAAEMLGAILRMSAGSSGAFLDIKPNMLIAWADAGEHHKFRLMIRAAPPMKHDILELSLNYTHEEVFVELPSDLVKRFIARATVYAEAKSHTHVLFGAVNGGLQLSFEEGALTTDEQYEIAELVMTDDFPEVRLDAGCLARALGHADMVAFDAFDRGVLTLFTSPDKKGPEFAYLINGAQQKGA